MSRRADTDEEEAERIQENEDYEGWDKIDDDDEDDDVDVDDDDDDDDEDLDLEDDEDGLDALEELDDETEEELEAHEFACNVCPATSIEDPKLKRSAGRACPFCGEGVIQLVEIE